MSNMVFGGPWTNEKLGILRRYLDAYTTALKNQPFNLIYVDAFAGSGSWTPRSGYSVEDYGDFREFHSGSSKIALEISDKAFDRLVFIDIDPQNINSLETLRNEFPNRKVEIVNEDANIVLPKLCGELTDFDRAVVFLDPYATEVAWSTVEAIAHSKKIDCWILFPLMAVTRMMTRNNEPDQGLREGLDGIFGGRQHWQGLYSPSQQLSLLGDEPRQERRQGSDRIADLYRTRLESIFARVASTRKILKNSKESPMFDLFFAASNSSGAPTAIRIADDILKRW